MVNHYYVSKGVFYFLAFIFLFAVGIEIISSVMAVPVGPSSLVQSWNSTANVSTLGYIINISGGYIDNFNMSSNFQDLRWKAFVGRVTGKYALSDAGGSTIYDWTFATITGNIYSTRNGTTINWPGIGCATGSQVETENNNMNLTNKNDNITATFKNQSNPQFFVGAVNIGVNSCGYVLSTYVNNISNYTYKEIALNTQGTMVYAAPIQYNMTGYNGDVYDFQMIVPENGGLGFTGQTAYYMYIELS